MTQELKDKALDILSRSTIDGNKVRLPEEEIDTEVWTIVKDALVQTGAQYNKKTKLFVCADAVNALTEAKAWLQEQQTITYETPAVYTGPKTIDAEAEDLGPDGEAKKEKKFIKERRTLRYNFSASETHELAQQLARETTKIQSIEEEKSSQAAHYASLLKEKKATQNKLSTLITNGYEMRDIDCEVYYNQPEAGKKTIIRTDTNEVQVMLMDRDEYNLFNQPLDEEELAR